MCRRSASHVGCVSCGGVFGAPGFGIRYMGVGRRLLSTVVMCLCRVFPLLRRHRAECVGYLMCTVAMGAQVLIQNKQTSIIRVPFVHGSGAFGLGLTIQYPLFDGFRPLIARRTRTTSAFTP